MVCSVWGGGWQCCLFCRKLGVELSGERNGFESVKLRLGT